jgi:cytochrome c-type biogenesis protein CcmH/NrfG
MEWTSFLVLAGVLALFAMRGLQARMKFQRMRNRFAEGAEALTQDRPAEAETLFRDCVRLSPATSSLHRMLGRALAAQARYEEAARSMETAAYLEPKNADARLEHGLMLAHCGPEHEAAAARALEKAVELNPELRAVLRDASQLETIRNHPAVIAAMNGQQAPQG